MTAAQHEEQANRVNLLILFAPYLFVVLWSTGFIGARLGLPHAEPFTFLSIRLLFTFALMGLIVWITSAPWPRSQAETANIAVVGMLAHGGYLAGNFYAMGSGMPLAIVALIGGLQPLLTAVLAGPVLKETVSARAWTGLLIGLVGVLLVLWHRIGTDGMTLGGMIGVVGGLIAMTAATLYQKRYCPAAPLRSGALIQFAAAVIIVSPLAFIFETRVVQWNPQFVFAIVWLALVLSLGAVTILWILVRRGEAAKVASMFYLTPPVTALMAYVLFNEPLGWLTVIGMAVAAIGVALVTTVKPQTPVPPK